MFYLIQHMWLYLLLAAIFGAWLMWLLRKSVMRDQVAEVEATWQSRWNNFESEHFRVTKALQVTSEQAASVPTLEAEIENLKVNYQTLTDQYAALDADWKKKYGVLEIDWRGRLANMEKGIVDLRAQLNASVQEHGIVRAKLEECVQKRVTLENENEQIRMQIDEYSRRVSSVAKEISEARTQIVMLTEERNRLQSEAQAILEHSQDEDRALQQQLTVIEQEREQLKTQLAQAIESETEWRSKCQETDSHYTAAQQQIAGLMARLAAIGPLEVDKEKLQAEVADWSAKHAAVRQEADGYFSQVRQLTDRISTSESEHDKLEREWKGRWATLEAKYKLAEERLGGDIERIEGVGAAFGQRLRAVGIEWVADLLDQCGTPQGRATVAEKTGVAAAQLLIWTNMADLLRMPGITPDWAELLHAAGVDTVKDLAQCVPENLQQRMEEMNTTTERKISPTVPDATTIVSWVEQAKTMEYRITY